MPYLKLIIHACVFLHAVWQVSSYLKATFASDTEAGKEQSANAETDREHPEDDSEEASTKTSKVSLCLDLCD